ncbi:cupin domain-containing protein [Bounagaea algeriensis]
MIGSTVLHLLPLSVFQAERTEPLRPASLDHEGFVHCSPDLATTLAVANNLYRDANEPMIAVELDPERIDAPLRWEAAAPAPPPGVHPDTPFPHVYGPVDRSAVVSVYYARCGQDGTFLSLETRSHTAEEFDLLPHPEGGWYRRTWTSPFTLSRDGALRPSATAIYFLLTAGESSRWHTVESAELWMWHRGGPLSLYLGGEGELPAEHPEHISLGAGAGQRPQALAPARTWQCASAAPTVETLVSCVVSPGFDFADFHVLTEGP